ncbi:copper homeostasis membrane protein CopD [Bradyrhizobium sp. STM 3809]|uniref:copper homeostasis membrane protein CopD n=1 Tax=Bradyrhizobium sp. STM 3809 TaxID=551936 RepID=UPI0002409434|nr:copper homeostasis membrane protein CopD [Bradyrhizobium sp. STM 3809]CCE01976.1 Copper resistance D [Bradyrhizobium sp. STM 3809]
MISASRSATEERLALVWYGAEIDAPLVVTRAVHFAATAITAGLLIFRSAVLAPACGEQSASLAIDARIRRAAWAGLVLIAMTGAIWFLLQAASMSGMSVPDAATADTLSVVGTETQFGLITQIRAILLVVLAVGLLYDRSALLRRLSLAAALGVVAATAWTGHAGATAGEAGTWHLIADVLHLWAAAAWTGGLVGLMLLLFGLRRIRGPSPLRTNAVRSFSTLGLVSVTILAASGAINSWILVGSLEGLLHTVYGRLLAAKLAVFATMLALAAVNRLWLTPRLAASAENRADLVLACNTAIELVLALLVFALVGALGTQHPAIHFFV